MGSERRCKLRPVQVVLAGLEEQRDKALEGLPDCHQLHGYQMRVSQAAADIPQRQRQRIRLFPMIPQYDVITSDMLLIVEELEYWPFCLIL